ncbi:MAG: DUF494 domain-containing protein [Rhodocyclaceae bacterium]|nr:DUF494 domain-containing protein [Rhodocyclaceae bacterium]
MIDILVYLFENYQPDACPAPAVLTQKLAAAGFEADDISAALLWLDGLGHAESLVPMLHGTGAIRIYTAAEQEKLSTEARGFLAFLEHAEAIDAVLRETIIERALALPTVTISVDRLKVIVLAVVWRRQHAIDALILEELLADDEFDAEVDSPTDAAVMRILLN